MINFKKYSFLLICFALMFFAACNDKWDEHNGADDPNLQENLFSKIEKDNDLKLFAELLVKSGYDSLLRLPQNFTVWAPSNDALANLDNRIINNREELRAFVGNHIAATALLTTAARDTLKVKTVIGKNILFTPTEIDDVTLKRTNGYASNGVLHVTSAPLYKRDNIYEFLLKTDLASNQREAVVKRNQQTFDPKLAKVIGVDPNTGKPIYAPGSGIRTTNTYLQSAPINSEDRLFTYIVLTDAAFSQEMTKLKDYFSLASGNQDSTKLLTEANILKDLAFDGLYTSKNLPDSLKSISADSVKIHINSSDIVRSIRVSNGIVHVVNKISYNTVAKLGIKVLQGENYASSGNPTNGTVVDRSSVIATRVDSTGKTYTLLRYPSPANPLYWFRLPATLHNLTYKVYWRAIRDFNLVPSVVNGPIPVFPQKVTFGKFDATGAADLGYKNVGIREVLQNGIKVYYPIYSEVYLGQYTKTGYGAENVFIVANTAAVSTQTTSIALDYIKLVPIVN